MSIRREDIKDMCTRAGLCGREYGAWPRDWVPRVNSVSGSLEINLESFCTNATKVVSLIDATEIADKKEINYKELVDS